MYLPKQTAAAVGASKPWAVNNLKGHVLALATNAHAVQVLDAPKHSVIQQVKHLIEHDGGIAVGIYQCLAGGTQA